MFIDVVIGMNRFLLELCKLSCCEHLICFICNVFLRIAFVQFLLFPLKSVVVILLHFLNAFLLLFPVLFQRFANLAIFVLPLHFSNALFLLSQLFFQFQPLHTRAVTVIQCKQVNALLQLIADFCLFLESPLVIVVVFQVVQQVELAFIDLFRLFQFICQLFRPLLMYFFQRLKLLLLTFANHVYNFVIGFLLLCLQFTICLL